MGRGTFVLFTRAEKVRAGREGRRKAHVHHPSHEILSKSEP